MYSNNWYTDWDDVKELANMTMKCRLYWRSYIIKSLVFDPVFPNVRQLWLLVREELNED